MRDFSPRILRFALICVVQDIRLALGSLLFAQNAADEADGYATYATVPLTIIKEEEDAVNGERARSAALKVNGV